MMRYHVRRRYQCKIRQRRHLRYHSQIHARYNFQQRVPQGVPQQVVQQQGVPRQGGSPGQVRYNQIRPLSETVRSRRSSRSLARRIPVHFSLQSWSS